MSTIPTGFNRVSNLLQASVLSQSIESTQQQLLTVQNELSTGHSVNNPSDNPSAASMVIQLQQSLARQSSYSNNINSAASQLGQVDSDLGGLTTLLQQAQQVASADVGSDVSQTQRSSDATVIQSIYNQALAMANQQSNGQYLFGGAVGNSQPFNEVNGNVVYSGSSHTLQNTFDDGITLAFQIDGGKVFGALSTGATGSTDVSPQLTPQTLLTDVGGASGNGVRLSSIQLGNGAVTQTVNLSSASSVGDVVNLINAAGVGGITASITGQGLTLSGAAGDNITVTDLGGTTAEDLGIATPAAGAGVATPVVGQDIQPKVNLLTPLSDLQNGAGIDNSGLVISNGGVTKTITWSPTGTVQDMLNAINGAGLGVTAEVNPAGTGIDILNATQGADLSVGENGGATASQLGIRTLDTGTLLASLNNGAGVRTAGGATPDFQITAANGATFQVSVGAAVNVQDVLDAVNAATGGAVTASLATTGNGIVLTDSTGGGGTLSISRLNDSNAATDLGINVAAAGNTISGADAGSLHSAGIFGNLAALAAALESGNQNDITNAASGLATDTSRVIELRGQTGSIEQELQSRQSIIIEHTTTTQALIGQLQDTDMAATISQFQTLQTALQASLQTAASSLQLSLLNFLS
jgi:flagellin-like hook-associated protein FlgL